MTSTCNSCIHLHRFNNTTGQCRRHSPFITGEFEQARFPIVQTLQDWCGEYEPNFHPYTEDETQGLISPFSNPILTAKPTPYRKLPPEGFTDYGN